MQTREVEWMRKETQPPRRYSDASLLGAMETAGKEVEDAELREAMKDSGIGTPATRASIIERLVDVGYIERDGRALVATEKGIQVIRLLGEHQLTSPELTGSWERRLRLIEQSQDTRPAFMDDIKKFTDRDGPGARQAEGRPDRAGQAGPVPDLRARDHREPEGLLVLVARRPRLRLRDLEEEGGQEPARLGRQGADRVAAPSRSAARTQPWGAPRSPSPASAPAPGARSARSSGWSRPTRASGAWSSTRTGRRSPPPASPRRSARRPDAQKADGAPADAVAAEAADGGRRRPTAPRPTGRGRRGRARRARAAPAA